MAFNMNRTWSQAIALMRGNFQLLALIAGVFILLPSLVISLVVPAPFAFLSMGDDPERMAAAMAGVAGPLIISGLVAFVLQMIGYGSMIALTGDSRPTVGEAIKHGIKSLPSIVGAFLLFIVVYVALAIVLSLVVALLGGAVGEGAAGAVSFVLFCLMFVAVLYMMVRLSLTLPVIILEDERNPITALRRSWRMTKPFAWPIFGFYVLLFVAYFIISLLLLGVIGVIAAGLGEGPAAALFMGLVQGLIGAAMAMVLSGILVSMHQQLAGRRGAALSQPVE